MMFHAFFAFDGIVDIVAMYFYLPFYLSICASLDLVGKPAASAAEPTGNYIYIVLTPCGFGVQVHIEASRARTAARA